MPEAAAAPILKSRTVCQIAIVVRDVERAAKAWAAVLGVPPPAWHLTDPEEKAQTRFEGKPTQARAKLAFFKFDNLSLELIEPVGAPSTWQQHLDEHGESVHHIAFHVEDIDAQVAALGQVGIPLQQAGQFTGGCYRYLNSQAMLGVVLELLGKR